MSTNFLRSKIDPRPSPDQGLGSSVSSSTTSLQPSKIDDKTDSRRNSMAQLRAQFFSGAGESADNQNKTENRVLDRRKSDVEEEQNNGSKRLDALSKEKCNDIKQMFEENIAIKKGLKPDPTVPKGPVVKMRKKVNPNLPNIFKKNEEEELSLKQKRESVPIDRKMFNHFLNKFEDDESRQAAKNQLWKITQKQKGFQAQKSWSEKQDEIRKEEERKKLEEIAMKEAEAKRKAEEEERIRLEEEERQRKIEEEKAEELRKAKEAEEKKKKTKKKVPKKKGAGSDAKELPNLVANTCSDLRRKFQELKTSNEANSKAPPPIERPKARRLMDNPFEKRVNENSELASVKKREFPVGGRSENRLGDIKKRFSQFMSAPADKSSDDNKNTVKENDSETEVRKSSVDGSPKADSVPSDPKCSTDPSPVSKRISLIQSSVDAVKGSFEKITNSKEKLTGAFGSKKNKKPSIADMQGYLISHVLYDGQVKMDLEDPPKKKEDDLFDFLEEAENDIAEEDLMNDEYIKGLQIYLSVLDEAPAKKSKKKKKKKKVEEPAQPALATQQVSNIKAQFEINKRKNIPSEKIPDLETAIKNSASGELKVKERNVGRFKNLFESSNKSEQKAQAPLKRQSKLISNELLQKFDSPEMAEELKKQKEKEREDRKVERMRRLEEERKRIEEEMKRAKKLEEERKEKERQEQLKKEEEARQELLRKQEEERMKIAYEKMIEEEKKKAEHRRQQEEEQKARREKSEPAFKQKKVLGRIQHIFQKKMDSEPSKQFVNVGSVKGVADELFSKKEEVKSPVLMNDPTLAGVGGVLNSVKNKFEATDNDQSMPLSRGVPMKKKDIPAALAFEEIELKMKNENEITSPKAKQQTEWAWKKKDPGQLAAELNKGNVDESDAKQDRKKSSRAKKSFDRQKELLQDIQAMNSRLSKKNALKEHEDKMEEYSKFMDEIQDYLAEPDQTGEETTFKDDIKTFITSKLATKKSKQKKAKAQPTPKPAEVVPSTSISKIKEQLMTSNDTTDSKFFEPSLTNHGKVESLKSSIIQQYSSDKIVKNDEQIEVSSSVNAMKEMFEADKSVSSLEKTKVKKKIIELPQQQSSSDKAPPQEKTSYEWKYKKKSIQDLQDFMTSNKNFVTAKVNKAVDDAREKLEESVLQEQSDRNEEAQIKTYSKMMDEVEQYLSAPDKSKEEIEFKEQIEKYLDLVEMPSKQKEKIDDSTLGRKPKKLNMSLYIKPNEDESPSEDRSPLFHKSKESASVKELQSKLFLDNKTPDTPKEKDVIVHNAGTQSLKRGYEKLTKSEKVQLVSAPKIAPQKFFGDLLAECGSSKTLEQLKTEGKENTWKWKQKAIGDLHTYMTGHLSHASKEVIESHKSILKADIELQNVQGSNTNRAIVETLTKERDNEMDKFLKNVKNYLDEPNRTSVEDSVKTGIQSYLNLIEDGSKDQDNSVASQEVSQKFLPSGQVSSMKDQLEGSQDTSTMPKPNRQVGKLRSNSFNEATGGSMAQKRAGVSKRNADDIKESLVKKFFVDSTPKDIMKAPKTKLVQTPDTKTIDKAKPIEPKKQWKPPVPILPVQDKPKDSTTSQRKKKEEQKYVSKYAHITDENERKAAILAQFGCKPRPQQSKQSDSDESSDNDEDMTNYIENDLMKNNDLYVLYGDRLRAASPSKQKRKKQAPQPDSVEFLKGILGTMRNTTSRMDLDSSSDDLSLSSSPQKSNIPGSCSNIRSRFENSSPSYVTDSHQRRVEKSSSFSNVGRLYEQSMQEKSLSRASGNFSHQVGRVNVPNTLQSAPMQPKSSGFLPGKHALAKSASFHKLKHSFENQQFDDSDYDDEDEEDEDVIKQTDQRSQIESELEEIRSCTRLQKMFNINKPRNSGYLEKSSSSSAIPDHMKQAADEDIPTVSEARNSIKNIFEASSFKVTYGGGKSLTEQLREKEKTPEPQPKKKVQFSDRTWVLNTINKYFDVIDEDEDEEEYEDEENYSDEEGSDEEDEQVFSTQVSAQRVVYPSALPPHLQVPRQTQPIQQKYEEEYSDEEEEEIEEEEEEDDEYEIELEIEDEEEESPPPQQRPPLSSSLLQKSSSSSRIRGLFKTVLQKSESGAEMNIGQFKMNLNRHLQKSNQNIAADSDTDDDEEFEDCPEVPMETSKFYRIPL